MNVIVEGVDGVGKSTQIDLIEKEFEKRGYAVHIIHYSNIKFSNNMSEIENASKKRYSTMFDIINNKIDNCCIIFDRSHLGEAVYSPIYRKYSGDYVFDFEDKVLYKDDVKLVLFTDDVNKILIRDLLRGDGKSFSLDKDVKEKELKLFDEAFNKSKLIKKRIHLNNRSPEEVFSEVKDFIWGSK